MKKVRQMDATKSSAIILLQITFAGFVYSKSTCLTWNVEDKTLILIFRTENFSEPLTFIDTAGKDLAGCNFKLGVPECYSRHPHGNITADILQKKIVFSFDEIVKNDTYVNGLWTCLQGNDKYFTRVSTKEGIINSTDLKLYGKIMDSKAIELTCSSCREPHGNYIEFLIDDLSFTSVSFSKDTNQCKHGRIACRPGVCSCSLSGNTFTFTFSLVNNTNGKLFSCEMRFVDRLYNSRFLKVTTVYYNGTHLISKGTKTNITKPASPSETISEEDTSSSGNGSIITTEADVVRSADPSVSEITINWTIVAPISSVSILIVVICFVIYLLNKRNLHKQRQNTTDNGEVLTDKEKETLLIGEVSTDKEKETSLIEYKTDDVNVEQVDVSPYEEYHCSPCFSIRMVAATTWCMECGESFCSECAHCHHGMKISHGHILVDIKEVPSDYINSTGIYCTEHSYSKYENYCYDEDQLCCELCVQHNSCSKLESISKLSENIENTLQKYSSNITKILDDLDVLKKAHTKHNIQINCDVNHIEKSLSRIVDEANQESVFDEKTMAFIEQSVRAQYQQLLKAQILSIEKNSEIINCIEKMMNSLRLQTECIDFLCKNGSSKLVYIYISSITKKILHDIGDQMRKITCEGAPRLQYDRPTRKSSLAFGTITIYYEEVIDSKLNPKEHCKSQVPVIIENNAYTFSNIF